MPQAIADCRYVRVHEWDNLRRKSKWPDVGVQRFADERALNITTRSETLLR